MKKIFYLFSFSSLFFFFGCTSQQIQQAVQGYLQSDQLSVAEVTSGLKQALTKGVESSVKEAGSVNGFLNNSSIRIPLPESVQKVEKKLKAIGLGKQVDDFVTALNRGAENAAKEAAPIFLGAISSMTLEDAWSILKNDNQHAATDYLQKTTSQQLQHSFYPIIKKHIDNTHASKYYDNISNTYNKIPFVNNKIETDLTSYATQEAMKGLFKLIAKEETLIREDPAERVTDLLKKVFSQQD